MEKKILEGKVAEVLDLELFNSGVPGLPQIVVQYLVVGIFLERDPVVLRIVQKVYLQGA